MTLKSSSRKEETATSESPQVPIPFDPVPDDAVPRLLGKLFELAINGNIPAAKLLLDILDKRYDGSQPTFTTEDALKLLQEHFSKAA